MPPQTMVTQSMAARVFALKAQRITVADIARLVGIGTATVHRTLRGDIKPRPDVVVEGWTAQCMEPDELEAWQAANALVADTARAERPCADCTLAYALEMRGLDRCNGSPEGIRP